jgi:5-methyltetrahydrofolate--homocysteine methyltransferase
VVRSDGPRGGTTPDGRPAIRFPSDADGDAFLPIPGSILETSEYATNGRIKHVMAAARAGLAGGQEAELAAGYVRWMAARQVAGGADYLDLNVDEIDHDVEGRLRAMVWLVQVVGPASEVPVSIDSSDAAVLAAGLEACDTAWAGGAPPMINSASVERPEVLELALERGCPVVLSCTGTVMPTTTDERLERATEIVDIATGAGLPLSALHVDQLIMPIAVDPESGNAYLDAVRQLRDRYGPELHITGGISNVSFGMPARRLVADVFLDLCVQAGQDSGIVDPVAADLAAALAPDRDSEPYRLAADLLLGVDAFGLEFIGAFRSGRLESQATDGARR